jgi:glycosyltransferase involved in cell wall biosynthesis
MLTVGRRPLVLISGKDVVDRVGGHASYVRAHALAAIRAGFEPHIFEIARTPGTVETEWGTVHRLRMPHRHPSPIVLHMPFLARAVTDFVVERADTQVVHSFGVWAAAGATATRALARRGIYVVPVASAYGRRLYEESALLAGTASHHPLPARLRYQWWVRWIRWLDDPAERRGYAGSKLVLINYESVRRILTDAYGPGLSMQLVPYASPSAFANGGDGLDAELPAGLGALGSPDAPLIVSISRHDPRKGQDVLLLALARLARDGVAFRACLAGNGGMLSAHRRLATNLGLDGKVMLPGRISTTEPLLRAADVFVLPSRAEASGSVSVVEALDAGKAVVASACDGIPEDLTDAHDALLVAPGDVDALAGALRRLLTDRVLRERLAENARATHERRFSADGLVAALAEVYDSLLADPRLCGRTTLSEAADT